VEPALKDPAVDQLHEALAGFFADPVPDPQHMIEV
jgi:hypothetical protein